jgi:hypothetical protein
MRRAGIGIVAAALTLLALGAPAEAGNPAPSVVERQFVGMLNAERAAQGLAPVEISPALTDIADDYVAYNDQVGGIDHARDAPYTARANEAGCGKWDGPVLALGYTTPDGALQGWLSSPGHRAVLLDPEITHIGAGFKNQHALAFGMPCQANAQNTSGDFGDANATEPPGGGDAGLSLGEPKVRGKRISVTAEIQQGSTEATLTAKRRGETRSGRSKVVQGGAGAVKLKVKVNAPGKWRLSVMASGEKHPLGKVSVGR